MKRTLLIECSHLSCHPIREVRTGIQEIEYQVLHSLLRRAKIFEERYPDWTVKPLLRLPWRTAGIDLIPAVTSNKLRSEFPLLENIEYSAKQGFAEVSHIHLQSVMSLKKFHEVAPQAKLSVTLHDLGPVAYPDYVPKNIRPFFLKEYLPSIAQYADLVVAASEFTARDFQCTPWHRESARPQKIALLRPAPRMERSPQSNHGLLSRLGLEEKSYFVFLGSFEPRKNLAGMIEGYRKYQLSFGDTEAKMVWVGGTGWQNDAYPIENWIKTGYLSDNDMRDVLQSSAGLILISVFEGYGLPLAQARSLGIPVITHHGSSLPEAAGFNAIFVDPSDGLSIAQGLKRAFDVSHGIFKSPEELKLLQPSDPRWNWDSYTDELVRGLLTRPAE